MFKIYVTSAVVLKFLIINLTYVILSQIGTYVSYIEFIAWSTFGLMISLPLLLTCMLVSYVIDELYIFLYILAIFTLIGTDELIGLHFSKKPANYTQCIVANIFAVQLIATLTLIYYRLKKKPPIEQEPLIAHV